MPGFLGVLPEFSPTTSIPGFETFPGTVEVKEHNRIFRVKRKHVLKACDRCRVKKTKVWYSESTFTNYFEREHELSERYISVMATNLAIDAQHTITLASSGRERQLRRKSIPESENPQIQV